MSDIDDVTYSFTGLRGHPCMCLHEQGTVRILGEICLRYICPHEILRWSRSKMGVLPLTLKWISGVRADPGQLQTVVAP